jgi:hypothetical protein
VLTTVHHRHQDTAVCLRACSVAEGSVGERIECGCIECYALKLVSWIVLRLLPQW